MAKLSVAQDGYLEAKLVDESPTPVYFDDLLLKISKERGIQENHYDPWGLNLVGIESQPVDRLERKQYNGKERVSDFGLEWNFHDARTLDKQTGRWCQVDPLASKDAFASPYVFCRDNALRWNDPDGKQVVDDDKNVVDLNVRARKNAEGMITEYYILSSFAKGTKQATKTQFSNNAGKLLTALVQTELGRAQFQKLTSSTFKVQLNRVEGLNPANPVKTGATKYSYSSAGVVDRSKISTITIYEGIGEREGEGFSSKKPLDPQRASVMGHEIEHLTDENVKLRMASVRRGEKYCDECENQPNKIGQAISEGQ